MKRILNFLYSKLKANKENDEKQKPFNCVSYDNTVRYKSKLDLLSNSEEIKKKIFSTDENEKLSVKEINQLLSIYKYRFQFNGENNNQPLIKLKPEYVKNAIFILEGVYVKYDIPNDNMLLEFELRDVINNPKTIIKLDAYDLEEYGVNFNLVTDDDKDDKDDTINT